MKYNLRPDETATLELRGLYEKYGYKKYKISKFEEYSLYVENRDFFMGDKVLTFTDLDGRLLAMKPDVTLSIINNTRAGKGKTEKIYYIENVYRESKENHSFKEINQMGLEYMGDVTKYGVLEVIALAAQSLNTINSSYLLEISNMNYAMNMLGALGLTESVYLKLLNNIRRKNITGIADTAREAGLKGEEEDMLCRLPFLYGRPEETVKRALDMALDDTMKEDVRELEEYCEALRDMGYSENIQLDFSMVNDIDYYNGIIFRGYVRDLPGCVLAGGQYDRAMKLFGKKAGAIGFAIYLDELTKGRPHISRYDVDAVLIYGDADMRDVAGAVKILQEKGMSVRAERSLPDGVRYREMYVLRDGMPVKEEM